MNTELIEKEFDKGDLEQKPGPYGKLLTYVATPAYIRRMNDVFDYAWSSEVVKLDVYDDEVVAIVKVTAGGVCKTQAGGKRITRDKEGNAVALGDDAKSAISTAFKKACQLYGIGLYLAEEDDSSSDAKQAHSGNGKPTKTTAKTNGGITDAQLGLVRKLRTEIGWSSDDVVELANKMFKAEVPDLNKTQASGLIAALKKQSSNGDGHAEEARF